MLELIKFNYEESADCENLFTPFHTKHKCVIKYNGKQFTFNYQCNTEYTKPNISSCIECLLLDCYGYDNTEDILDFADEFGYNIHEQKNDVRRAYNACKRTSKALHRMFTDDELSALENEING